MDGLRKENKRLFSQSEEAELEGGEEKKQPKARYLEGESAQSSKNQFPASPQLSPFFSLSRARTRCGISPRGFELKTVPPAQSTLQRFSFEFELNQLTKLC